MSSPALEAEEGNDPRSVTLTEHDSQQAPMSLHSASSLSMSSLAITPQDTDAGAANGASDDFLKSLSTHGFSGILINPSNALQNKDSMMKMLVS